VDSIQQIMKGEGKSSQLNVLNESIFLLVGGTVVFKTRKRYSL